MAYELATKSISLPASGDLSSDQYRFVKVDTNGRLAVCGDGDLAIGILQDAPNALGRVGRVVVAGVSKCVFGASVNKGAAVSSDSSGRATTIGSSDDNALGTALDGGSSGTLGSVLFHPVGKS